MVKLALARAEPESFRYLCLILLPLLSKLRVQAWFYGCDQYQDVI